MKLSKNAQLTFGLWLPIAAGLTLISLFAYWAVQQNYRLSANDPQIQILEDSQSNLANVTDLSQLATAFGKTDISKTLSPFLVIYDDSGKPIAGNGYLNDNLPNLPAGVFDAAKKQAQDRFTWQPRPGLRFAAVLIHFSGKQNGFAMAARSLREIEAREDLLTKGAAAAWGLAMILSLLFCGSVAQWMLKNFSHHGHEHASETKTAIE